MKKRIMAAMLTVMLTGMMAGCSMESGIEDSAENNGSEDTKQSGGDNLTIGFSNWSRSFEFYVDLEEGMQEKADELGVELVIQDADGDLTEQTSQLENFVSRDMDGIIICPIDSEASGSEVEMVNAEDIPLATVDIECTGGGEVVTHVASDNYLGGQLAAEYVGEALGGEGKIAVISNPTITTIIEREKGFTETIEKEYPGIEIVANQSGESTREKGMEVAENILEKNPDLDAVFGTNDMMALGAVQAIQAKNLDTIVVGFDATEEACNGMKEGSPMKASVAQQPQLLGATVLESLVNYINGEDVEPEIKVEVKLVTEENADDYLK